MKEGVLFFILYMNILPDLNAVEKLSLSGIELNTQDKAKLSKTNKKVYNKAWNFIPWYKVWLNERYKTKWGSKWDSNYSSLFNKLVGLIE